ncbi:collagen alpha-1(III) chain-like [Onychostruthus taczanowskii]|uniref:collagen alpha-1(III) chain-like n=1 Tax=Onychostruthus taczanowskii TaxID=356909 RepID=UPI001B800408|nr:collagen alpha-1(III) chain-like [Onychostruthus taczanowskii]
MGPGVPGVTHSLPREAGTRWSRGAPKSRHSTGSRSNRGTVTGPGGSAARGCQRLRLDSPGRAGDPPAPGSVLPARHGTDSSARAGQTVQPGSARPQTGCAAAAPAVPMGERRLPQGSAPAAQPVIPAGFQDDARPGGARPSGGVGAQAMPGANGMLIPVPRQGARP